MPLDNKEETVYFNSEKLKATKELLSEGVEEMITLALRRAFVKGYNAKDRYEEELKKKGQPK